MIRIKEGAPNRSKDALHLALRVQFTTDSSKASPFSDSVSWHGSCHRIFGMGPIASAQNATAFQQFGLCEDLLGPTGSTDSGALFSRYFVGA